jgi:HPt (histidine-containing phosphotransfer) domain-containing protein
MENLPVFDLETALEYVGGEHSLLVEVIQTCLDGQQSHLEKIRTALKAGDAKTLERAAHQLKGSLLLLSAQTASAAAQSLEDLGREGALVDAKHTVERLENEMRRLTEALESFLATV